jgi:hypothetical protein
MSLKFKSSNLISNINLTIQMCLNEEYTTLVLGPTYITHMFMNYEDGISHIL